jgi:hypothetical protein
MSEQRTEQNGHETASRSAGSVDPNGSDARSDRLMASEPAVRNVEAPQIVSDQEEAAKADDKAETTRAGMPKAEPFTVQGFKVDAPKPDMPKADAPYGSKGDAPSNDRPGNDTARTDAVKTDAVKAGEARLPRELTRSPGERNWKRGEDRFETGHAAPKPDTISPARGRRFAAMAAMLLLAVVAGAAGGAFATIGLSRLTETSAATAPNTALEASVGRIDADIIALKAGLERTSTAALTQFNKTGERLERIEKAQAEPAARLAKLSDAVDKLRAAAPAATTPVATAAAKDVTGTVTTSAGAQALPTPQLHAPPAVTTAGAAPTTEVGRLPTVEGWVLRDVDHGSALIQGRPGLYEVMAGDPVPGLGRVDAIRRQDGRWVVVTSKGLIVAR